MSAPVIPSPSGSPEQSTARKVILGPWKKTTFNIILIGETGVGKTAMLDLLANLCADVELDDFRPIHLLDNELGGSEPGSQTLKPRLYSIECANGHRVNILDTPGLGDIRGIDKNTENKRSIVNAIKDQMEEIDAILIMADGSIGHVGISTDFVLNNISSLFPNSIVDNIGFMFTMVSDPSDVQFVRTTLPKELQQAPVWSMNNPFSRWCTYQARKRQELPVDPVVLREMHESVMEGYQKALELLSDSSKVGNSGRPLPLFQWLDERTVQATSVGVPES